MLSHFLMFSIRCIAVNDDVGTDSRGSNELMPVKDLFNERLPGIFPRSGASATSSKGNAGEPMGQPPCGYRKDPDNLKRWIIEETAAAVVRRIYRMSLDGMGVEKIAGTFSKEEILTPRFYWQARGVRRAGNPPKYGSKIAVHEKSAKWSKKSMQTNDIHYSDIGYIGGDIQQSKESPRQEISE